MATKNPFRLGLNLGGGGARGLAHLGVLRALEENNVKFDISIGVSMGALVAANYSYFGNIDDTENSIIDHINSETFRHSLIGTWRGKEDPKLLEGLGQRFISKFSRLYKQTEMYSRLLLSRGILDDQEIAKTVMPLIPNINFSQLKKPFACVAVDLETGMRQIFNSGPLRRAVLASLSMPLVFPPVEIDGHMYTDGGIVDRIGVDSAFDLGVEKIIAVDVSNDFYSQKRIRTAIDIMLRTEEISAIYRKNYQLKRATIVIKPIQETIHWADYHDYKKIIQSGYDSTLEKIDEIKREIGWQSSILRFFRKK